MKIALASSVEACGLLLVGQIEDKRKRGHLQSYYRLYGVQREFKKLKQMLVQFSDCVPKV